MGIEFGVPTGSTRHTVGFPKSLGAMEQAKAIVYEWGAFSYVWISNTACIIKDNGTATVGHYGMRTTKQRQKNIGGFIQSNASLHRLIVQLLNFKQLIQCVVYCIVYFRWMYYMCERVRACGNAPLRRILFWDSFLSLGRMIWPLTFQFSLSKRKIQRDMGKLAIGLFMILFGWLECGKCYNVELFLARNIPFKAALRRKTDFILRGVDIKTINFIFSSIFFVCFLNRYIVVR